MSCITAIICVTSQKPRLNTRRKKPFTKIVAEMATAEDHGIEAATDAATCEVDDTESSKLIGQRKNGLTYTPTDFNCNVAQPGDASQT